MHLSFAVLLLLPLVREPAQSVDSARLVVRLATKAVDGDSVAAVSARWRARLSRNPGDRTAILGLATVAKLSYKYSEASRLSAPLLSAQAPDAFTLELRLQQAATQLLGLELSSAESSYARVRTDARKLHQPAAEVDALIALSEIRRRRVGPPSAVATLDTAFRLATDSVSAATLWCSNAFRWARKYSSLDLARAGVSFARAHENPRLESSCEIAAARELQFRGSYPDAGDGMRRALALSRQAHDRVGAAAALRWLGQTWRLFGQYERALNALRESAVESAAAVDRSTLGYAHLNLGLLTLSIRDLAAAEDYARRASAAFARGGDFEGLAAMRYLDGTIALTRNDVAAARAAFGAGLAWAARSGDGNAALDMHLGLSEAAVRAREWSVAEREFKAVEGAQPERQLSRRGALALARGDLPIAEKLYNQWLSALHPSQHDFRYEARSLLAFIYLRRGDVRRAETELSLASQELDGYRASLSDAELRLHAVETATHFGAPTDASQWIIAALVKDGRLSSAFELMERRRARELLEQVARVAVLRGTDSSARLRRGSNVRSLDSVIAAIPDDRTAVLEYVASASGAPTTLLVIMRSGARGYVLAPLDSLQRSITALETLIEAGGGASIGVLQRRLGEALLAPALTDLPATITRLLVVPDGMLHRLPIDALSMKDGRLVVERFAVATTPSAAVAVELWRRPSSSSSRILTLGDPTFATRTSNSDGATVPFAIGELARLPESGREARDVARFGQNATVRLGADASESYVKRAALDSFAVIHFATHAVVDEESASRTALVLSPGGGEDGFVGPADLATLNLRAELVVLSACRTARGPIVGGEGLQGLTTPFIQAGARSIVASGWRIGDAATRSFMLRFYTALSSGAAVVDALQAAKLGALRAGKPPRDWAAFALIGNPATRISLRPGS